MLGEQAKPTVPSVDGQAAPPSPAAAQAAPTAQGDSGEQAAASSALPLPASPLPWGSKAASTVKSYVKTL